MSKKLGSSAGKKHEHFEQIHDQLSVHILKRNHTRWEYLRILIDLVLFEEKFNFVQGREDPKAVKLLDDIKNNIDVYLNENICTQIACRMFDRFVEEVTNIHQKGPKFVQENDDEFKKILIFCEFEPSQRNLKHLKRTYEKGQSSAYTQPELILENVGNVYHDSGQTGFDGRPSKDDDDEDEDEYKETGRRMLQYYRQRAKEKSHSYFDHDVTIDESSYIIQNLFKLRFYDARKIYELIKKVTLFNNLEGQLQKIPLNQKNLAEYKVPYLRDILEEFISKNDYDLQSPKSVKKIIIEFLKRQAIKLENRYSNRIIHESDKYFNFSSQIEFLQGNKQIWVKGKSLELIENFLYNYKYEVSIRYHSLNSYAASLDRKAEKMREKMAVCKPIEERFRLGLMLRMHRNIKNKVYIHLNAK